MFTQGQPKTFLFIGNSIVYGGNSFKQTDKLFSLLQDNVGEKLDIVPVAVGGWTQLNEIAFFKRHHGLVTTAQSFGWEYMSGGLSRATPWAGEYVFPTRRPDCVVCYAALRYGAFRMFPWLLPSELPVKGEIKPENISSFESMISEFRNNGRYDNRGFIWLYPTLAELKIARSGKEWLPERGEIMKIAKNQHITVLDIATETLWGEEYYKPDQVHPTVEGNRALSKIIAAYLKKS